MTQVFMTKFRNNRMFRYNLLVMLLLLIIGLFWLYPFWWVVFASFKSQKEMFTAGAKLIPETWDFSNYTRAWVKANFSTYFFNTVVYSVTATLIELVKSSTCGYVLARYRFPGRDLLTKLILATLFIPIASVILPQFQLIRSIGLLNTRAGVILPLTGAGALYVLLFKGFFETIPDDLFSSAKIDGAGFFDVFRLMLPLARPIIGTVVIFQFMSTWNNFNVPLIFTLGRPELRNLAVGMYSFRGEYAIDWTGFAAGTVISIIPVLLVFFAFQGYFVRGLSGAVKQ